MSVIRNTQELYPGSNVIAIVRNLAIDMQKKDKENNVLKIAVETEKERIDRWQKESSPMPLDCRAALQKLGIKLGRT